MGDLSNNYPGLTKNYLQENVVGVDLFYNESYSDSVVADSVNKYKSWQGLKDRLDTLKGEGITGVRIHVQSQANWGDGDEYQFPQNSKIIFEGQTGLNVNGRLFGISVIETSRSTVTNVSNVGPFDGAIAAGESGNAGFGAPMWLKGNLAFSGPGQFSNANVLYHLGGGRNEAIFVEDGVRIGGSSIFYEGQGYLFVSGGANVSLSIDASSAVVNVIAEDRQPFSDLNHQSNVNYQLEYSPQIAVGPSSAYDLSDAYTPLLQNAISGIDSLNQFIAKNVLGNYITLFAGIFALGDTDKEYDVRLDINGNTTNVVGIPARTANGVDANVFFTCNLIVRQSDIIIYSCARQEWGDVFFVDQSTVARPSGNLEILFEGRKGVAADTFQVDMYNVKQDY